MGTKIYDFLRRRSTMRRMARLATADVEVARDLHTLAEAERRRQILRSCAIIARNDQHQDPERRLAVTASKTLRLNALRARFRAVRIGQYVQID
jgi:hypothetical protein